MSAVTPPPYRSGMATGLGVVLLAGAVLGVADVAHTGGGAGPALPLLALWSLIALPAAAALGVVLGAGNATWGDRWVRGGFRRLRDDPALDRAIAAALIAAALLGGVLALVIAKLAVALVGDVQRKSVGGLLLGVAVVGALPLLVLARAAGVPRRAAGRVADPGVRPGVARRAADRRRGGRRDPPPGCSSCFAGSTTRRSTWRRCSCPRCCRRSRSRSR